MIYCSASPLSYLSSLLSYSIQPRKDEPQDKEKDSVSLNLPCFSLFVLNCAIFELCDTINTVEVFCFSPFHENHFIHTDIVCNSKACTCVRLLS